MHDRSVRCINTQTLYFNLVAKKGYKVIEAVVRNVVTEIDS